MDDCNPKLNEAAHQEGANLVRLKDLTDPIVLFMFDYWKEKRGSRLMPSPNDMNPVDFARLMPHLQMVQVDWEPFDLSYRLLGEEIAGVHGGNYSGRAVLELNAVSDGFGTMMFELFRAVATDRRPYAAGGTLASLGRGYTGFQGVYMPLCADGEKVNRIICCSSYEVREGLGLSGVSATTNRE
ncbi:PAS domain-containing protein [Parvibaculum sp.]|uniref:PAS domain-containing protein n=1 Tax=Parvibaculum sp. TaxID=2024848 RepID=UPI003296B064